MPRRPRPCRSRLGRWISRLSGARSCHRWRSPRLCCPAARQPRLRSNAGTARHPALRRYRRDDHAAACHPGTAGTAAGTPACSHRSGPCQQRSPPRENPQQAQQQHLIKRINHFAALVRVRQVTEIFEKAYRLRKTSGIPPHPQPWQRPAHHRRDAIDSVLPRRVRHFLHPIAQTSACCKVAPLPKL